MEASMSAPAFARPHRPDPDRSVLPSFTSLDALNHALQLDGSRGEGGDSMNLGDQFPENDWNAASQGGGERNELDRQVSLGTALQQAIAGASSANKPKTIEETWRDIQHAVPVSQAAISNNPVKIEGAPNYNFPQGVGWRGVNATPAYGASAYPGVPSMGVAPAGLNTGLLEEILRNQRMAAFAAAAAVNASQNGQRQGTGNQAFEGIRPRQSQTNAAVALPGAFLPPRPEFGNGVNGVQSDFRNFQARNVFGNQVSGQVQPPQQHSPRSGDNAQNPILVPQGQAGVVPYSPQGFMGVSNGQRGLVIPKSDPDRDEDSDSSPRGRGRKRVRIEGEKDAKIEKRTLRMIKNRESAARSRLRKQAYTQSLEAEINELKEENNRLRRQKEAMGGKQSPEAKVSTMNRLRRTRTGPW